MVRTRRLVNGSLEISCATSDSNTDTAFNGLPQCGQNLADSFTRGWPQTWHGGSDSGSTADVSDVPNSVRGLIRVNSWGCRRSNASTMSATLGALRPNMAFWSI